MSEPKFKQGDRVFHILTGEFLLIIKSKMVCDCERDAVPGICVPCNHEERKGKKFTGNYLVMMQDYSKKEFPEWQLELEEKEIRNDLTGPAETIEFGKVKEK